MPRALLYRARLGHSRCDQDGGRGSEPNGGPPEQPVEADHGQKSRRHGRTEKTFEVVGESGEGEGFGVLGFLRQNVRNGRLESGRERRRSRLEQENQQIDLPDLIDKRQE